jgi:acyl-CoA thioester hydrolase
MNKLTAEKELTIRFSEVDAMNIVWHGSYSLYFEDAREEFGRKYQLEYLYMFEQGFYAPLVELHFNFKRPLTYKDNAIIEIVFRNTDAAKLIFDYTIFSHDKTDIIATGYSVQVFLDKNYNLMWNTPKFIVEWKKMNGII